MCTANPLWRSGTAGQEVVRGPGGRSSVAATFNGVSHGRARGVAGRCAPPRGCSPAPAPAPPRVLAPAALGDAGICEFVDQHGPPAARRTRRRAVEDLLGLPRGARPARTGGGERDTLREHRAKHAGAHERQAVGEVGHLARRRIAQQLPHGSPDDAAQGLDVVHRIARTAARCDPRPRRRGALGVAALASAGTLQQLRELGVGAQRPRQLGTQCRCLARKLLQRNVCHLRQRASGEQRHGPPPRELVGVPHELVYRRIGHRTRAPRALCQEVWTHVLVNSSNGGRAPRRSRDGCPD